MKFKKNLTKVSQNEAYHLIILNGNMYFISPWSIENVLINLKNKTYTTILENLKIIKQHFTVQNVTALFSFNRDLGSFIGNGLR